MYSPELIANVANPGQPSPQPVATLTQAITTTPAAGTVESYTVSQAAPADLRSANGQFRVALDNEIMIVQAKADGSSPWSFIRGAENTTPAAHTNGTSIYHLLTKGALQNFSANTVIASVTGDGSGDDYGPIQTALNFANSQGGGHVVVPYRSSGVCRLSAGLIIYSNTTFELKAGVVLQLDQGVDQPVLQNAAFKTTGRNVPDVSWTAGGTTLTCIQAPQNGGGSSWSPWTGFSSADVGRVVVLRDNTRPQSHGDFVTTIASVPTTPATAAPATNPYATATLASAIPAGFTVSRGFVSIANSGTAPIAAPVAPAPTTSNVGGTIPAGTYTVAVSYVNANGETVASSTATVTTTGATSTITVPSPAAEAGATGWYAYVSQIGGTALTRQQKGAQPSSIGTNLILTAPPTNTGASSSPTNTTGNANRDRNIEIFGGTFKKQFTPAKASADSNSAVIWIERCDAPCTHDTKIIQRTTGGYMLAYADVTDWQQRDIKFDAPYNAVGGGGVDAFHINGPATNGKISGGFGTSSDDACGLNAFPGTTFRHCAGPIWRTDVENIHIDAQSGNMLGIWVGDVYNATVDELTTVNVHPTLTQTNAGFGTPGVLASVLTGEQAQINCGTLRFVNCSGTMQVASNNIGSTGTVESITLTEHVLETWMMPVGEGMIHAHTALTIQAIKINNLLAKLQGSTGSSSIITNESGLISLVELNNLDIRQASGNNGTIVQCVSGTVGRTIARGVNGTGGSSYAFLEQNLGASCGEIFVSDFYWDGYGLAYANSNNTRNINVSNVHVDTGPGRATYGVNINSGTVTLRGHNYNGPAHVLNGGSVNLILGQPDAAWTAATLQNSWANLGSSFSTAAYRKDAQGYVHLKGVLSGGVTTTGTVLLTLPAGYRPLEHKVYEVAVGGAAEVRVMNTGNVQIGSTTNADAMSYLSLESIPPFLAEQ